MTPSKDFNLHSLAKKAKHRLIGKLDNSQVAYVSKAQTNAANTTAK